MSLTKTAVVTMTIANGAQLSEKLSALLSVGQHNIITNAVRRFVVWAPGTLTGTVTLLVSPDSGGTGSTLSVGGSDATVAGNKATYFDVGGWGDLQLSSSSAEGAERTFKVIFQLDD